ncbi:hypothetical protein DMENIID0001_142040 [Sergentomyia squamirostris]
MESSFVWGYFKKSSDDTALCNYCSRHLKCTGSSTTGLRRHLRSIHNISPDDEAPAKSIKKKSIKKRRTSSDENPSFSIITEKKAENGKTEKQMKIVKLSDAEIELKDDMDDSVDFVLSPPPPAENSDPLDEQRHKKSKYSIVSEGIDSIQGQYPNQSKDDDMMFFESFIPSIKMLPLQQKMEFRMEFQKLLYNYMFKKN